MNKNIFNASALSDKTDIPYKQILRFISSNDGNYTKLTNDKLRELKHAIQAESYKQVHKINTKLEKRRAGNPQVKQYSVLCTFKDGSKSKIVVDTSNHQEAAKAANEAFKPKEIVKKMIWVDES